MHLQYLFVDPTKLSQSARDHCADIGLGRGRLDVDSVVCVMPDVVCDPDRRVVIRDYKEFLPFLQQYNAGKGRW